MYSPARPTLLFLGLMLAGLGLAAVIAWAFTRPKPPPGPVVLAPLPTGKFEFDQLAVYDPAAPLEGMFASANLHEHPGVSWRSTEAISQAARTLPAGRQYPCRPSPLHL